MNTELRIGTLGLRSLGVTIGCMLVVVNAVGRVGMRGSAHDFSGATWNASSNICFVCHSPHSGPTNTVPEGRISKMTQRMESPSIRPSLRSGISNPTGPTYACLACHDGVLGRNTWAGQDNVVVGDHSSQNIIDRQWSHPVSVPFDSALARRKPFLHDPQTRLVPALGKTIDAGLLSNGRLECTSCHDIHRLRGDSARTTHLLVVTMDQDALCRTCHRM